MPIPVLTIDQMRQWEATTWASGQTEAAVIQEVGKAVATCAKKMCPVDGRILIVAGKGHNGEDARQSQPHLVDRKVILLDATDPSDALEKIKVFVQKTGSARPFDLIIDALFGIGLNRALSAEWQALIDVINQMKVPILAVDVPSGLNADTGLPSGTAIRAATTLTVGAPKIGLVSTIASEYVGRLEVASEVGLIPCPVGSEPQWIESKDFLYFPPARAVADHKGTFGHLAIVAGSLGYHGAAVLSARGALPAKPGLVTLYTPENVYIPIASQLQAPMVHPWAEAQKLPKNCTAILFGPGLASSTLPKKMKDDFRNLWKMSDIPMVADASALDWLEQGNIAGSALRVMTPHPGEAARLLNVSVADVQKDRFATVRDLSKKFGNCWVVLKGHQTLIGRGDGPIYINSSGNPHLAQGGSGDILAGFLSGLLAQPALQINPQQTIAYSVWSHGAAADRLSNMKSNWIIEELFSELGAKENERK